MQETITTKLRNEQLKLEEQQQEPREELEFFRAFFQDVDFSNYHTYSKIKEEDFLIAYVKSEKKEYNLNELRGHISKIIKLYQKNSLEEINVLIEIINFLTLPEIYSKTMSALTDPNELSRSATFYEILELSEFNENVEQDIELSEFSKKIEWGLDLLTSKKNEQVLTFIPEYEKNPHAWGMAMSTLYAIKKTIERQHELEQEYDSISKRMSINVFQKKKNIDAIMESEGYARLIKDSCKKMIKYYYSLEKQDKKERDNTKRRIDEYQVVIDRLTHIEEQPEITDYRKWIEKIPTPELQIDILTTIYQHNKKTYDHLEEEYQSLSENSLINYQRLIEDYHLVNISIDQLATKHSYRDAEWILKTLMELNIKDSIILGHVLQTTSKSYMEEVKRLVTEKIITVKALKGQIPIFEEQNNYVPRIRRNAKVLREKGLKQSTISNLKEALIVEEASLERNTTVLKDYQLLDNLGQASNVEFLKENNIEEKLDLLLEQGLETELEQDLGLLSYDKSRMHRLKIVKELEDLDVQVPKETLKTVLTTTQFIVSEEDIDSYIFEQELSEEEKESLTISTEDITETTRCYYYHGLYFSKNKVNRTIQELENLNQPTTVANMLFTNRKLLPSEKEQLTGITKR